MTNFLFGENDSAIFLASVVHEVTDNIPASSVSLFLPTCIKIHVYMNVTVDMNDS